MRVSWVVRFFREGGILVQLLRIALLLVVAVAFLSLVAWVGNPALRESGPPTAWHPPPLPADTEKPDPPLPPGFPSMEMPPPMVAAPEGRPQPVPTRYGLSYSVPPGPRWQASNQSISGWTDDVTGAFIALYGAASDYGAGYCRATEGSALAHIGVRGRNGVEPEAAAREEVEKARRIFSDSATGRQATVTVSGPESRTISGRPAVRFTAAASNIPKKSSCDPTEAGFDIIATPAYASAEVAVFMVEHHRGLPNSLSDNEVDAIIATIAKTP
ncbi:hypothetical protein ACWDSJ_08730 [Nocardia sp. NPDC003482]